LKVVATVTNVNSTKRETIKGQLGLEDFSLSINNETINFPRNIGSGEQVEKTFSNYKPYKSISISSNERYGYKTFTKDW
jgi:hypothetical protein